MTLLDRFRTQPRHNHSDPVVRLAYVSELPLDDREAIVAMARQDEDARVRRAAVAKLMDPRALASIAETDRDEGVRGQAVAMLRDIALEVFEGSGESESLEAVDAMRDPRLLAVVAKSTTREIVALRAISRIDDAHILGSIVRHGAVEGARRNAFESLRGRGDDAEILAVAMNGDFKDTALLAVELITDRGQLEQIAVRGRNKSAAKRARGILREADEHAAANAEANEAPASDSVAAAVRFSLEAEAASELEPPPPGVEEIHTTAAPSRTAVERGGAGEPTLDIASERARARMAELVVDAEAACADADLGSARRRLGLVRREWNDLASRGPSDLTLEARLLEIDAQLAARDAAVRDADSRARREALARLHSVLGRVEPLTAKPDVSLKAADRALRDIRAALASIPPLPSRQDAELVAERLKAAQSALIPRLQELREADDWRRFANVAIQEQLCAKMEALHAVDDPAAIAREIHHLQEQWRTAAEVPRAQADALWRRFKAAHDVVWPRCEAHFAALAVARVENLARKTSLCQQAESLADSTKWIQTAEEIKKLQAEWKTIGAVSHGREKAVWDRFRVACDRFFTRRHEDLAVRKAAWAENLARKEALCLRAEALAESAEWDSAAAELKKLQAEWKTIGAVKKTKSDAIWLRFRVACDRFFLRYAQRHDTAKAERVAAREAICAELEQLAESDAAEPVPDLLATVRALRARWHQEMAARGVDPDRARALDARFSGASARVVSRWNAVFAGSDLDPEANRKRMEALVQRIEDLSVSIAGPPSTSTHDAVSSTTRLATMLKEALAANTIGGKLHEDNRLIAAADEVRHAQAAWSRIGAVPDEVRRQLADRFQRACRRITERVPIPRPVARTTGG